MAFVPKKPCAHPGCPSIVPTTQKHCEEHQGVARAQYEKHQRPRDPTPYRSQRWRNLRLQMLEQDPFCASCGELATLVHHIKHWSGKQEDLGDFFDPKNLQPMCSSCHSRMHATM